MNKRMINIFLWTIAVASLISIFGVVTLELSNRELAKDNTILSNQITALEKENTVWHDTTKKYIMTTTNQPFKISHYHSSCQQGYCNTTNVTASGTVPTPYWTVATDPQVIPLGSYVIINGKMYLAVDSGVFGNTIDICVTYHEEAIDLGVFYTDNVYILTEVPND